MAEKEVIASSINPEERIHSSAELIPADVYGSKILPYLPAKNLQILQTVCKDWFQLITSSRFVRLHLSVGIGTRIRVLVTGSPAPAIIEYNNYEQESRRIAYPPHFSRLTSILGSADGLVYLQDRRGLGYANGLFNPSTGKCFNLQLCPPPPDSHAVVLSWFGSVGGGEYVLLMGMMITAPPRYEVWVYKFSPSSNIINLIHSTLIDLADSRSFHAPELNGTLVQGVVHWPTVLVDDEYCPHYTIFAYHIDKNKQFRITPPVQCEFGLGLFTDGCSLYAVLKEKALSSIFDVWVMKQENCWTKFANIEGPSNFFLVSPLGFDLNGDLIMDVNRRQLMKYSFNHKEVMPLMEYGFHRDEVIMCADSLVSPAI